MAQHNESRRGFHPAVSISSWLLVAIAVELAIPAQLPWLAAATAFLLLREGAARRFVRLLWKARWLWLALVLLHAWTVPGALLWPSDYSPSQEGLHAGLIRVSRLALLLAALACLLSEFSPRQLAGGIYLLAKPLAPLGLDRRALAVRLALTLENLEQPQKGRPWRETLASAFDTAPGPDEIRLPVMQAGLRDALVLFAAALLLMATLSGLAA